MMIVGTSVPELIHQPSAYPSLPGALVNMLRKPSFILLGKAPRRNSYLYT